MDFEVGARMKRSNSSPCLSRAYTFHAEVADEATWRPGTPNNPVVDCFANMKDIDILDVLNNEDLERLQLALQGQNESVKENSVKFSAFRRILHDFSVKANDWQLKRLFDKIDVRSQGSISWEDVCEFAMQTEELKAKALRQASETRFHMRQHPLLHKTHVTQVMPLRSSDGAFAIGSNDGMLTVWTRDLRLKTTIHLTSSLVAPVGRKKWCTGFLYLYDINKIVVSTGDRELEFYEMSTHKFYFRINDLDMVPMCLAYGKLPRTGQHTLIWGDSNGVVSILLITDLADLLRGWRSLKQMDDQPTMKISAVVVDPKITFLRWKTHDEWVAKVDLEASEESVISCCNHARTAVVIGRIIGLTPAWRDDFTPARRKRDITSSETTSSSRSHLSRRTVSRGTCIGSDRFSSIFTAKRRDAFEQRVFKMNKGARTFALSKEKNVLVTGGMDRIIRIWNPYITTSPFGKLIGHISPISALWLSPEDMSLISVSSDTYIKVWELDDFACLSTFSATALTKTQGDLQKCAYSHETQRLLLVTDEITLVSLERSAKAGVEREDSQKWEYYGGCWFRHPSRSHPSELMNLKSHGYLQWKTVVTHKATVELCKYNRTFNQVVTASSDSSIRVWNLAVGQLISELTHTHGDEPITCMCFDLTERRLITGGRDGVVRIWNHHSGACLLELQPKDTNGEGYIISAVDCINIGTGRYIAVVGWNPRITLYQDNLEMSKEGGNIEQHCLPPWRHRDTVVTGHREDICKMSVSRQLNLIATADFSGEICVWNAVSGHVLKRLSDPVGDKKTSISGLMFVESRVALRKAANLVSCGPNDAVHLWAIYSNEPHYASFHTSSLEDVAPTALAVARPVERGKTVDLYLFTSDERGWIQVWDITNYALVGPETTKPPRLCTWRGHTECVTDMEAVAAQKLLITASVDWCARVWTWDGGFVGSFGQPTPLDLTAKGWRAPRPGPFDVLMDPQTHAVPELQNICQDTTLKEVDSTSSRIRNDANFEKYTQLLFGAPYFETRNKLQSIAEALQKRDELLDKVDIKPKEELEICDLDVRKNRANSKIFHYLPIFPLDAEKTLNKPVNYTDPERLMEDVEEARLYEDLPPLKRSFEKRILSQQ